ncbi:unnamed protein product [Clonostachys rosea]|uniref:BTB domain-containing protein n=1 Tax=Bionectria ochroleuca TaxID=29856 RepID=A0ABY6V135_BIOOC|nr:unnamed protein product [Clonostachys rosea]
MAEQRAMAHAKQIREMSLEMLQSGKYSDFVLSCGGTEWKLHKAVVCIQCPVIAAAFDNGFNEATTGRITSHLDIETMTRLVQFFYVGDYSTDPELAGTWPSLGKIEPFRSEMILRFCLEAEIKLNIAADYYGIAALSSKTRLRIKLILRISWKTDGFLGLLKKVEQDAGDKLMVKLMIDAAALHIDELIELPEIGALDRDTYHEIMCTYFGLKNQQGQQ